MKVATWNCNGMVYISVETESGSLVKAIDRDKFTDNYDQYFLNHPKQSKSKHGITIERKAMEKCYRCKNSKPVTEFNAYRTYEHPCYDCCSGSKHKFTLPFEI